MRRAATFALLTVLTCFAIAGWLALRSGDDVADATTDDPGTNYSDLLVTEDDLGWFQGSIRVQNDENADRRAFVTVNLYEGEQNVGELSGNSVLKPNSESAIDLISTDPVSHYDEARVDLWFGMP